MRASEALDGGTTFLTAGGTETYLLFQQGFPLRDGCAFEVLDDAAAWERLCATYLAPILEAAAESGHGVLLDTLVWRAHPDFIAKLGYPASDLARFNELAVARTREALRAQVGRGSAVRPLPVLLAGDVGPRGDGYTVADRVVTVAAARAYHSAQIEVLARTGVDLVCALTMTTAAESIGVARAAGDHGLPVVVSPTIETDGTLPDGTPLGELIDRVDDATGGLPLFYMVNCAHPAHLAPTLARARSRGDAWLDRFAGIRANASRKSHAELDESPDLDRGDPRELALEVAALQREFGLRVIGGCCGTDAEHVAAIARATAAGQALPAEGGAAEGRSPAG